VATLSFDVLDATQAVRIVGADPTELLVFCLGVRGAKMSLQIQEGTFSRARGGSGSPPPDRHSHELEQLRLERVHHDGGRGGSSSLRGGLHEAGGEGDGDGDVDVLSTRQLFAVE